MSKHEVGNEKEWERTLGLLAINVTLKWACRVEARGEQ